MFISYRSKDAPGHARRLYDVLSRRFGVQRFGFSGLLQPRRAQSGLRRR